MDKREYEAIGLRIRTVLNIIPLIEQEERG